MDRDTADIIVEEIIEDLRSRYKLGDIWDDLPRVRQDEIAEQWANLVLEVMGEE